MTRNKDFRIGLDIGFGDVKAVCEDGVQIKFPTAVTHAKEGMGELKNFPEEEFFFNGKKYLLGKRAMFGAFSTMSFDFMKRYAPLLAYKVVKDIKRDVSHITVGLPLMHYTPEHKSVLESILKKIEVNNEAMNFKVNILPQGVGILLDYRLSEDGSEKDDTDTDMLALDIGFNTVDVVSVEDGTAVKADSGMLERAGISKIALDLSRRLQAETTINLSEQEAKDALQKGNITVYGHEKDLTEVIRDITENYVEWLLHTIQSRWEDRIQRAKKLIIAGGGAYCLKDYIPSKYQKLIHIPEEPEFANARGFLKAENMGER